MFEKVGYWVCGRDVTIDGDRILYVLVSILPATRINTPVCRYHGNYKVLLSIYEFLAKCL